MKTQKFLVLINVQCSKNQRLSAILRLLFIGIDEWEKEDEEDYSQKLSGDLDENAVHCIIAVVADEAAREVAQDRWHNSPGAFDSALTRYAIGGMALIRKVILLAKEVGVEVNMANHESEGYNLNFVTRLSVYGLGSMKQKDGRPQDPTSLLSKDIVLTELAEKQVEEMLTD